MLIDIVHFILFTVLGPSNYYKGINCLRTLYDVPSLVLLLDTIETANMLNRPVEIDEDLIRKGIDEFKRILDLVVDNGSNMNESQKLSLKDANAWIANNCYQGIMFKCVKVSKRF